MAEQAASGAALHPSQARALENMRAQALSLRSAGIATLEHIFLMSDIPPSSLSCALSSIRNHARIALHFHPDRPARDGRTVARALLDNGEYRSQFETGISNGSVSAHPGGARDEWERALFEGAYHIPELNVQGSHRPKYGALDLVRNPDGPAIRFGSCFFLLKPEVSRRSTFTFGGSQDLPKYRGTAEVLEPVLAALFEECFFRDFALGVPGIRPPELVDTLLKLSAPVEESFVHRPPSRNLDHVVEAQVHGDVRLGTDVELLVADPSFQGTDTGANLESMAAKYSFPLVWHGGFRLKVEEVPSNYRGPTMPSLATRVGRGGYVDARAIGEAVCTLIADPAKWTDRGPFADVLQELKLLWHVLVRFGESANTSGPGAVA
ncbi:hypothetical protein GQ53DRAFT_265266 [Thozetella sp. PMI_491]|nr:hypothetical protein GQ53DRAFT_265266 [Thozetella sp. PMI_491]